MSGDFKEKLNIALQELNGPFQLIAIPDPLMQVCLDSWHNSVFYQQLTGNFSFVSILIEVKKKKQDMNGQ